MYYCFAKDWKTSRTRPSALTTCLFLSFCIHDSVHVSGLYSYTPDFSISANPYKAYTRPILTSFLISHATILIYIHPVTPTTPLLPSFPTTPALSSITLSICPSPTPFSSLNTKTCLNVTTSKNLLPCPPFFPISANSFSASSAILYLAVRSETAGLGRCVEGNMDCCGFEEEGWNWACEREGS